MKKLNSKIMLVSGWILTLFMYSCEYQEEQKLAEQSVQFKIDMGNLSAENERMLQGDEDISAVVVSIRNRKNKSIVTQKKLSVYDFNGQYISEPLALFPGSYYLQEFFVIDSENKVVMASPIEGSELAYLVEDPLEIDLLVVKNKVVTITPEVLRVNEAKPRDFGYASFSFEEVLTFQFQLSVFVFDEDAGELVLTSADLTIEDAGGDFSYSKNLINKVNLIKLPEAYGSYTLSIIKSGYRPYSRTFESSELKGFVGVNGPLLVTLEEGLVLWNKLGSVEEVENSEVGPNGSIFGSVSFDVGRYDNGVVPNIGWFESGVDFPGTVFDPEQGTLEFWMNTYYQPVPYEYGVYGFMNNVYFESFGQPFNFLWHNPEATTLQLYFLFGPREEHEIQIFYNDFYPKVNQPVHLAVVWDRMGIEGSEQTLRIYINGEVVAYSQESNWGTDNSSSFRIANGWDSDYEENRFSMDNLKVYNYAKTDFSDRDTEGN